MAKDTQLVRACRRGDLKAFEVIVGRYQSIVCAITYSAVGNHAVSEDLAQETFLRAWKNLGQLKEPEKFRSWLCSIARSVIGNYLRDMRRTPIMMADVDGVASTETEFQPDETLIRQEEQEMVSDALTRIPQNYREPLVLFYRENQSVRAVAALMGLTEATVRTRLHRARKMLRDQVESRIETTLKKTAPGPAFARSVMGAVGAGLAAGAAGTATAAGVTAATGATASLLTGTGGILTATAVKIAAAAAAVVIAAGVVVYTLTPPQDSIEAAPSAQTTERQQDTSEDMPDSIHVIETGETASVLYQTDINPRVIMPAAVDTAWENLINTMPQQPEPLDVIDSEVKPAVAVVRNPDWPGLNEPVNYVYVERKQFTTDRSAGINKLWARLPDALRDEDDGFYGGKNIIIDNGKERHVLDQNMMQAQLEQSWFIDGEMIWRWQQSIKQHPGLLFANSFRDPNSFSEMVQWRPLVQDSCDHIIAYYFNYTDRLQRQDADGTTVDVVDGPEIEMKAWVDKRTLLPERIEQVVAAYDPNQPVEYTRIEYHFDFSPIAETAFSTAIPSGYEALPSKQPNTYSGRVIDLQGNPVAGAEVHLYSWTFGQREPLKSTSDENGVFVIYPRPNEHFHRSLSLWAISPDEPELVGWTTLLDPFSTETIQHLLLAGKIPDYQAIIYPSEDAGSMWLAGASEIMLVMEPGVELYGMIEDVYGNPVPEASVSVQIDGLADIRGGSALSGDIILNAQADTDGWYVIPNVPRLWEKCRLWVSVTPSPASALVADSKGVDIEDPANAPIQADFVLLPQGPTVRGVVVDNYGTPLDQRSVTVRVNGKSFSGYAARTDENGRFEIINCPADAGLEVKARLSHQLTYSDDREKYMSYVYYPDVTVNVGYRPEQDEYEVELVAIKPEIEIEVVLVDSAGDPLPFFPVEIRADESISTQWRQDRRLSQRTDENGYIRFVNVPEMTGLRLVCSLTLAPLSDRNENEQMQELFRELVNAHTLYRWTEVAVPVNAGQSRYAMVITIPDNE